MGSGEWGVGSGEWGMGNGREEELEGGGIGGRKNGRRNGMSTFRSSDISFGDAWLYFS